MSAAFIRCGVRFAGSNLADPTARPFVVTLPSVVLGQADLLLTTGNLFARLPSRPFAASFNCPGAPIRQIVRRAKLSSFGAVTHQAQPDNRQEPPSV